jgi:hypothetical protein
MRFKEIVDKYKKEKKNDAKLNLYISKKDKSSLEKEAKSYELTLSEFVRIILKEHLKGKIQKKAGA